VRFIACFFISAKETLADLIIGFLAACRCKFLSHILVMHSTATTTLTASNVSNYHTFQTTDAESIKDPHEYNPRGSENDYFLRTNGFATLGFFAGFVLISSIFASYLRADTLMRNKEGISVNYYEDDKNRTIHDSWVWDHNLFQNPNSTERSFLSEAIIENDPGLPKITYDDDDTFTDARRNLLIAQGSVGAAQEDERLLASFMDISSLPNRAYARHWRRNYVSYTRREGYPDGSIRVLVLQTIKNHQKNNSGALIYDAVLLLPPEAIIVDQDFDFQTMLPESKLVSIAGWNKSLTNAFHISSTTGVIIFNLQHQYADKVFQLWSEMLAAHQNSPCDSCDVGVLLTKVLPLVLAKNETIEMLVHGLIETEDGFLLESSDHWFTESRVRCIKRPERRANPDETRISLQTTADAVCFRFFPKCEVL
jgi:hypothetical protein